MPDAPPPASRHRPLRRYNRLRPFLIPLALLLALALPQMVGGRLKIDSGLYWGLSIHACEEGHLWTPMAGDQPYFKKPPLTFWIHSALYYCLGGDLWVMRLGNLIPAAGCVILTVLIVRRLANWRAAMVAALIFVSSIDFFRYLKRFILDYWHVLFLLALVWLIIEAARRNKAWPVALAGVPLGLALMIKPLMALIALPILALWLLWIGRARLIAYLPGTLLAAAAVALPWHISMTVIHGDAFLDEYFGRQIMNRSVGSGQFDTEPWCWYFEQALRRYWPWLITLALGLYTWLRVPAARHRDWRPFTLCLLWCGLWLALVCCFADKRDRYIMHLHPMFAMISALWLTRHAPPRLRRGGSLWPDLAVAAILLGSTILTLSPIQIQDPESDDWLALYDYVRAHPEEHYMIGSANYRDAGRIYVHTRTWPTHHTAADGAPRLPQSGWLVLNDASEPQPETPVADPASEIIFTAGDLQLLRTP
jgi:4-amino-4-deoxy-L-arabinose transferase-like glycosyltransferase